MIQSARDGTNGTAVSATIHIRSAALADAEAMAVLAGELGYAQTRDEAAARLRLLLADADHRVFVAEGADGRVAGWLHCRYCLELADEPSVEIMAFIVGEAQRGHGLGAALLRRVDEWARRRGVSSVRVRARLERTAARAFYEHRGFRVAKQQNVLVKGLGPVAERPDA